MGTEALFLFQSGRADFFRGTKKTRDLAKSRVTNKRNQCLNFRLTQNDVFSQYISAPFIRFQHHRNAATGRTGAYGAGYTDAAEL